MNNSRNLILASAVCAIMLTNGTSLRSHPHVFAEARLDVVAADGQLATLRHLWRFDELFSSTVLVEFDLNSDLKLDEAELETVAKTVHESLADFNYFQFVTLGGTDVEMKAPEKMIADLQDNQLIILFESKPSAPLTLSGKLAIGVYDPTFYTAIDFIEDDMLTVENLPAACSKEVVRPDPDEAIAQNEQSLTEAFFDTNDENDLSKIFATRLELTC